jgi:hypothetical protein
MSIKPQVKSCIVLCFKKKRIAIKRLRMIETAYPLLGRGRGGLRTLSGVKNVDINEQTHPLPPPRRG